MWQAIGFSYNSDIDRTYKLLKLSVTHNHKHYPKLKGLCVRVSYQDNDGNNIDGHDITFNDYDIPIPFSLDPFDSKR